MKSSWTLGSDLFVYISNVSCRPKWSLGPWRTAMRTLTSKQSIKVLKAESSICPSGIAESTYQPHFMRSTDIHNNTNANIYGIESSK